MITSPAIRLTYYALLILSLNTIHFAHAEDEALQKILPLEDVERIHTSGSVHVSLRQSSESKLILTATKERIEQTLIAQNNNTVKISMKNDKGWFLYRGNMPPAHVEIYLPSISEINMSASGELEASDLKGESLAIKLNASSDAELGDLDYETIRISAKGSSDLQIRNISGQDFTLDATGSSDINVKQINSVTATLEAVGASDFDIDRLNVKDLKVRAVGASDIKIEEEGEVDATEIQVVGASEFNAKRVRINNASISATGASEIYIHAKKNIEGRLNGASSLIYSGDASINVSADNSSDIKKK